MAAFLRSLPRKWLLSFNDPQRNMFCANEIDFRVRKNLSYGEFGAFITAFLLTIYLLYYSNFGNPVDYNHYLAAVKGDFQQYFYGYWLLPLLYPFSKLPFLAGYFIWTLLNILGVWFAARVFNGNTILALVSYQLYSVLFYGQITGIICGMLALFWWGLNKNRVILGSLALFIAIAKPQTGGLIAVLLWLFADLPWKNKLRFWIIPLIGILVTTMVYPTWIIDILSRQSNVVTWSNISLRQWINSWGLLLFLPAFILKLDREKRFLVIATASICNLPYFLQQDLLVLLIFPVSWVFLILGYVPAIMFAFYSFRGHPSGVILPLALYLDQIRTGFFELYRHNGQEIQDKKEL